MSSTRSEVVKDSQRKGVAAGIATGATVALAVTMHPFAVIVTAPAAVVLGWRWWKHRVENGIRF